MSAATRSWRVGVIGTGKHGSRYARHIAADIQGLELAAISRRSPEGQQQAAQWSCRWHADWRNLVADGGVDCVVAALPPVWNGEVALACAQAGKPLLLEKPMAVSVAEAQRISEAFARCHLGLTIGQTLRYNRVIGLLREHLPRIGPLYSFSANQRLESAALDWLDDPALAGAGVSFHSAVHVFDALRLITGQEIVRVRALIRKVHSSRLEDHLLVQVELASGALGTVDCSKIGPARSGRFEFIGGFGQLHGDQVHNVFESIIGPQRTPIAVDEPVATIIPLLRDWLAFLRCQGPNPIPPSEGLAAIRVCEACLRSSASNDWAAI